ncbi:hypothetical protein BDV97DRAFT_391507 [Delphinella strobiligena]|nr:hypothetical protein BDV97DRAFT_391507 [Delphinella strobiligena]
MSGFQHSFFVDKEMGLDDVHGSIESGTRSWYTDDDQGNVQGSIESVSDTRSWYTNDDIFLSQPGDQTDPPASQTPTPTDRTISPAQQSAMEMRKQWETYYAEMAEISQQVQPPTRHSYHNPYSVPPTSNLITYVDRDMGRAGVDRHTKGDTPRSNTRSQPSPRLLAPPSLTYADLRPGSFITVSKHERTGTTDAMAPATFSIRDAGCNGFGGCSHCHEAIIVYMTQEIIVVVLVGHEGRPGCSASNSASNPRQNSVFPDDKVVKLHENELPLFPNSCVYLSLFSMPFSQDIRLYGHIGDRGMDVLRAAWVKALGYTIEEAVEGRNGEGAGLWARIKSSRLGRLGSRFRSRKSKGKSS